MPIWTALAVLAGSIGVMSWASGHVHRHARKHAGLKGAASRDALWLGGSLILVVAASFGAVRSAVSLGQSWDVSAAIVGTLVLAALTSIPNVVAAVQLAREGRGAAVVSESLNSNTLNILAGICLPALLIGFASPSPRIIFAALLLVGMKLVASTCAKYQRKIRVFDPRSSMKGVGLSEETNQ